MIVLGVTFAFFMAEALLHYQLGVWRDGSDIKFPQWTWPSRRDFISMIGIVGLFSYLSSIVIEDLQSDRAEANKI
jgi:hypothetical protein|tara:strand:+ start:111 stop:335 length:225 start_codon:yes stop_codon:yes gene_type:complete